MTSLIVALLLSQAISPPPGILLKDEGVTLGRIQTVDCTGSAIVCSKTGVTGTLSVSGGSGTANAVQVSVSMGLGDVGVYSATVVGQGWVTSTSSIVCQPQATVLDGQTLETYYVAHLVPVVSDLVNGVGFNLNVYSGNGASGVFRFACTGV